MNCPHCNMPAPATNYKCPHCGKVLKQGLEPVAFKQKAPSYLSITPTKALVPFIFLVVFAVIFFFLSSESKKSKGGKEFGSGDTINVDNPGEVIEIEDFIHKGKITYFYFYSPAEPLADSNYLNFVFESSRYEDAPDVIYKVNINRRGCIVTDYESPLAQYYGIEEVPYLIIYDASGKRIFDDKVSLAYDTGRK